MSTRFLANDSLWNEIQDQIRRAKHVDAAIAYIGKDGVDLLPLRKGDRLVVDLSMATVRQGATDPREVRKFKKRGVQVFTRGSLHAKVVITDKNLITSSANVSKNSKQVLDEAGIITRDPAAIRRALCYFDELCTEPVRDEYLKACIKAYRPPEFHGGGRQRKSQKRVRQAKLWFIGGLHSIEVSEAENRKIEKFEKKAERKLKHPEKTSIIWIRYGRRPKFMDHIRLGDWVIECITEGNVKYVYAPAQMIDEASYVLDNAKKKYLLMLESPDSSEPMTLATFRRKVKSYEPMLDKGNPRTRPIMSDEHADRILRLWTPAGRVSRRSK